MTDNLTWAEFADKYKPKDGGKFLDDRGQEWFFKEKCFSTPKCWIAIGGAGQILTCPLIPPKQKRKMWPALTKGGICFEITEQIFESEQQAKDYCDHDFISWPAVPNADGSFDVPE